MFFVSFQNLFQQAALVNFGWQDQLFLLLYIHVSLKKFLATAPRMNFGWGDVEEGAVCTTNYTLHSKHPLKQSVSFSSRGYSIYSFAQPAVLAQHWGKELWMLAAQNYR